MQSETSGSVPKVLVTGATGFIGSHTCVELLEKNYDIIGIDNFANSSPVVIDRIKKITGKEFKFYECDILDVEKLEKIFAENTIDCVIHFAGLKAVGESCKLPLLYYENNVSAAINLCKIMTKHNVKKMIFSSSATVYGKDASPPYKETMRTGELSNPYGRTKSFIEKILMDIYNSDKSWKIVSLRYFNPIGAHQSGLIGEDPRGIPNNLMPYI
ncbi:MAG: SDR family NAD(P)-dependent oxidoreductase, partial [Clostridia bacterium]|nr:SDR family NAD(P)-dependent oxidoreductase [Clostridia bacterium]